MRRISWRVLALLAVLLPAAPAAAEFKPLTEAAVRALFPADKIRPAKTPKGALAFETWREPELVLGPARFMLAMHWNGLDDEEWPMPRILAALLNAACGPTTPADADALVKQLYASRSLVPRRELGGNAGYTIRHRLTVTRHGCRIALAAEGARWNTLGAIVTPAQ